MLQDHLRAQGLHVQRNRLCTAIHHPMGAEARLRPPIRQHVYLVPCPNYLWHIDGNHKLTRWRMVLHHAVDGFSRLIVFSRCSTNNWAATVLSLYQDAILQYRCPFRVRTDHGGKCRRLEQHGKCLGRRSQTSLSSAAPYITSTLSATIELLTRKCLMDSNKNFIT